jgi:hypothetical protein
MARIAHEVMVEAERAFRRADALSAGMEPHLLRRVNQSAIYGYTNDREDRNVPPGDVLLAAALAAGISLDQKLGVPPDARDADLQNLQAQIAQMREEMARLRAELTGDSGATADEADTAAARAIRAAQRREWARRSGAASPPSQPAPGARRGGRTTGP